MQAIGPPKVSLKNPSSQINLNIAEHQEFARLVQNYYRVSIASRLSGLTASVPLFRMVSIDYKKSHLPHSCV